MLPSLPKFLSSKASESVKTFKKDESGQFSIMFAVTSVMLLLGITVAVDIAKVSSLKERAQNVSDQAVLAAARAHQDQNSTPQTIRDTVSSLIAENAMQDNMTCTDPVFTAVDVKVTCTGDVNSFISGISGKSQLGFNVESTAVLGFDSTVLEVSFVYDVSNSMRGEKIEALEDTLDTLVNHDIFRDTTDTAVFSLIPFSNTVALDSSFASFVNPGRGFDLAPNFTGCFTHAAVDSLLLNQGRNLVVAPVRAFNRSQDSCPEPRLAARFFNKDNLGIKSAITDLTTTFGTGVSDALTWGYRSLHPSMRRVIDNDPVFPRDFGPNNKKILILMTDGKPIDVSWSQEEVNNEAPGSIEQRSLDNFNRTCEAVKNTGDPIDIYVIALGDFIRSGFDLRTAFENCTNLDGEFFESTADDLANIVDTILTKEQEIRISR